MGNEKHTAEIAYTASEVSEAIGCALDQKKFNAEFDNHMKDKDNPHEVTTEQIGAAKANHVHTAKDVGAYSKKEINNKFGNGEFYTDESGNVGFGKTDSHEFYGNNNFSSGQGNKLGSGGYFIKSYKGTNGGAGFYYVDGTAEDAVAIQSIIKNGEEDLYITIRNNEWKDSWCKVISSSFSEASGLLCIEIENNFYTNTSTFEEQIYSENVTYNSQGTDKNYPELGYAVKEQSAYIFIVGHPEFGSFDLCDTATSLGTENISQNDFSFTSGYKNLANGRYSVDIGNSNSSGYCTVSMGRSNKGAKAQASVLLGDFNEVLKNVENVVLLGRHLITKFWNRIVLGSWNKSKEDNVLEVGNGTDDAHRANVFEVTKNGGIRTLEEYFPGSNLGTYDLSTLQEAGNYGNIVEDKLLDTSYVRIQSVTTAEDGKGSAVIVPVEPETIYYKRTTQGTTKPRYFSYIYVNADPKNSYGGLGLEEGSKYMLAFDMEVLYADNPTQIQISPLTLNYGASNPVGLAGVVGSIKVGTNHIYCPFDISGDIKEIGVYCEQKGDTYGDDQCSFIVSNVRLVKLLETENSIATLAIDKNGDYFCSYQNSGTRLINVTHNDYDSSPDYIGYTDSTSGVNYLGAIKKPSTSECSFRVISPDELSYRITTDERLENKSNKQTVTAHTENRDNPHEVTAEQVGTYDKDTIDGLLTNHAHPIATCELGEYQERISLIGITEAESENMENIFEDYILPTSYNQRYFINYQGKVKIIFTTEGLQPLGHPYAMRVDGISIRPEDCSIPQGDNMWIFGYKYSYEGYVYEGIEFIPDQSNQKFTLDTFSGQPFVSYNDGFMSCIDKDRIKVLETRVGDIDSALDEQSNHTHTAEQVGAYTKAEIDEKLKNPSYEEEVKLTGITTAVPGHDGASLDIYDNSVSSSSGTFNIDIQGNVRFTCVNQSEGLARISIDGTEVAELTGSGTTEYTFEGKVNSGISVYCSMTSATFTEFVKKTYVKDAIGDVDSKIGDIDTALDELHSYAQALIGGEA